MPNIEIRWKKAVAIEQHADHVALTIETPDGCYALRGAYVVAADGSRSPLRKMLGLESHGRTFRDRFLIADVKMEAPFPAERWFWFDPPFHPNQSVLLHRQPDNVWRIDFQLGWDADPAFEKTPERVLPRSGAAWPRCEIRARMGQRLYVLVRADGQLPPRPRAVRGRFGALRLAVRRARREQRRAGCREPCLETGLRAAGQGAGSACWIPTPASASSRPTRTSSTRRARPISSRRRARSAASSATRC
jgi:2-polyprenyl-6-methoxyphenol hydroxylase-like FAD-dependent oxidoreductase